MREIKKARADNAGRKDMFGVNVNNLTRRHSSGQVVSRPCLSVRRCHSLDKLHPKNKGASVAGIDAAHAVKRNRDNHGRAKNFV